jgi:hypothetical protein
MSTTIELKEELIEVKKAFKYLDQYMTTEDADLEKIAVHPTNDDFLYSLKVALYGTKRVEKLLREIVLADKKAILLLPDEDIRFIESVLRPNYQKVRRYYIRHHPDGWFEDFFTDETKRDTDDVENKITDTLSAALQYWEDTLDEDDERRYVDYDFETSEAVISSPFFRPDHWHSNSLDLEPIIQSAPEDILIPKQIKRRLESTYASFLFGNWFACIAMARTTLEAAVLRYAKMNKISTSSQNEKEKRASLGEIIDRVSFDNTMLNEKMHYIRKRGNDVMHDLEGVEV